MRDHQEICHYVNRLEEAVIDLDKIISLSSDEPARTLASYYHLKGRALCNLERYEQARGPLEKTFELLSTHTKGLITANGREVTDEKLLEPSAFDTSDIKDLKALLAEVQLQIDDTKDVANINALKEIHALKATAQEPTFVKVEKPEGFVDLTSNVVLRIGKKRLYNDSQATDRVKESPVTPEDSKKRKL